MYSTSKTRSGTEYGIPASRRQLFPDDENWITPETIEYAADIADVVIPGMGKKLVYTGAAAAMAAPVAWSFSGAIYDKLFGGPPEDIYEDAIMETPLDNPTNPWINNPFRQSRPDQSMTLDWRDRIMRPPDPPVTERIYFPELEAAKRCGGDKICEDFIFDMAGDDSGVVERRRRLLLPLAVGVPDSDPTDFGVLTSTMYAFDNTNSKTQTVPRNKSSYPGDGDGSSSTRRRKPSSSGSLLNQPRSYRRSRSYKYFLPLFGTRTTNYRRSGYFKRKRGGKPFL